jgi:hypothetical protein
LVKEGPSGQDLGLVLWESRLKHSFFIAFLLNIQGIFHLFVPTLKLSSITSYLPNTSIENSFYIPSRREEKNVTKEIEAMDKKARQRSLDVI